MMSVPDKELRDFYLAVWTKAVDTQMHFNEMEAKSRRLGFAFVGAALGLAVVLLSRPGDFLVSIPLWGVGYEFHVSALIVLGAALGLFAISTLDLLVYHRMLRGAVAFGQDLEEKHIRRILDLQKGMTQAITHFSRNKDASYQEKVSGGGEYAGSKEKSAGGKILTFYISAIVFLVVIAAGLAWATFDSKILPAT